MPADLPSKVIGVLSLPCPSQRVSKNEVMSGKGKGTPHGKGASSSGSNKSPGSIGSPFAFSAKAMAAAKPKQSKVEATQTKFLALLDALNDDEIEEFREFVREELEFGTRIGVCRFDALRSADL